MEAATGLRSIPTLVDGDTVVHGADEIVAYLDARYPGAGGRPSATARRCAPSGRTGWRWRSAVRPASPRASFGRPLLHERHDPIVLDPVPREELRGDALALAHQGEQQMLRPDPPDPRGRAPPAATARAPSSRPRENGRWPFVGIRPATDGRHDLRPRPPPRSGPAPLEHRRAARVRARRRGCRGGGARCPRGRDPCVRAAFCASTTARRASGPNRVSGGIARRLLGRIQRHPPPDAAVALLRALPGDAEDGSDLRPRAPAAPRGLDEVVDNLVAQRGRARGTRREPLRLERAARRPAPARPPARSASRDPMVSTCS